MSAVDNTLTLDSKEEAKASSPNTNSHTTLHAVRLLLQDGDHTGSLLSRLCGRAVGTAGVQSLGTRCNRLQNGASRSAGDEL